MNCEEIKRIIWLYDESSPDEQEVVNEHVKDCKLCQKEKAMRMEHRAQFAHAFPAAELEYPMTFTRSVMRRVANGRSGWKYYLHETFSINRMRYAFAGLSALLIVAFGYESARYADDSFVSEKPVSKDVVVMNSAAFIRSIADASLGSPPPLFECTRSCRSGTEADCKACLDNSIKRHQ